ncbi:hypothetical protein M427DRAFT_53105 [Gonapodya prolifera JEL478]|uniref:F-box domain-containing protein n=1 Tax=Gonapodya prolifera (strain JEL478) TaxID=1344416 RepID=A0A139AQY2_GONPJ|nr:hypothetical protein M427DRAFT_53105 [Gonapodya prolifera JEL478]|eukprot:KXS19122.1 hypothetical protein M427DRAFT_53105 [Gonapodya prolifera JEL478]
MLRAYQTQTLPDELLLAAFEYLNPGHFFRTIPIISRHWNALSAALLGESAQLAASQRFEGLL